MRAFYVYIHIAKVYSFQTITDDHQKTKMNICITASRSENTTLRVKCMMVDIE